MLRSLFSGVSGMKNNQIKMDVIANNIANVNTTAFKSGRVRFLDIFSQTLKDAASPTAAGKGGINPRQVGLGTGIAGIDTIVNQGSLQPTGRPLDCGVSGEGYFILTNGVKSVFSRDGAFNFDSKFNIVNSDGYKLLGYSTTGVLKSQFGKLTAAGSTDWTKANDTTPIAIGSAITINGKVFTFATATNVKDALVSINAESNTTGVKAELLSGTGLVFSPVAGKNDVNITTGTYDFKGITSTRTMSYSSLGIPELTVKDNLKPTGLDLSTASDVTPIVAGSSLVINGKTITFAAATTIKEALKTINAASSQTGVEVAVNPTGGLSFRPVGGTDQIVIDGGTTGDFAGLMVNSDTLSSLSVPQEKPSDSNVKINNFSIEANGAIKGVYDDGSIVELGKVALSKFANPAGLSKLGGNSYTISANSGDPIIGGASVGGRGDIQQTTLEMSNVDLASEFTDMIITNRAFQANSKTITTSDEMLQELLNLKR